VASAGAGTVAGADITDAAQCRVLAAGAAAALGEIDLVVVATGVSVLRRSRRPAPTTGTPYFARTSSAATR
jgi:NAD(P)-dependent dehydrogenase (short-subunit alcohol dehydrogenase family)